MPLHAQIICIGSNALFAFSCLLAAPDALGRGEYGLGTFLFALAAAAIYTCWVLVKFRRYLSIEASIERELQMERLEAEIAALKSRAET